MYMCWGCVSLPSDWLEQPAENLPSPETDNPEAEFVKLSFTQLVGESIVAIFVPIEAILKLENMDYCGKRLSESAVLLM